MTQNVHQRAQELIALAGSESLAVDGLALTLAKEQQTWLRTHLQGCASCREYEEAAGRAVRALRSQPLAADSALVRATQMRVRERAVDLRQQRERMWLVCLSCLFVGLSAAVTTPLFWHAFEWIGAWAGVSSWVWQAGYAFFWIVPALVVSAQLLARGTHWVHDGEKQWR